MVVFRGYLLPPPQGTPRGTDTSGGGGGGGFAGGCNPEVFPGKARKSSLRAEERELRGPSAVPGRPASPPRDRGAKRGRGVRKNRGGGRKVSGGGEAGCADLVEKSVSLLLVPLKWSVG